jgi:hypothetical protein
VGHLLGNFIEAGKLILKLNLLWVLVFVADVKVVDLLADEFKFLIDL